MPREQSLFSAGLAVNTHRNLRTRTHTCISMNKCIHLYAYVKSKLMHHYLTIRLVSLTTSFILCLEHNHQTGVWKEWERERERKREWWDNVYIVIGSEREKESAWERERVSERERERERERDAGLFISTFVYGHIYLCNGDGFLSPQIIFKNDLFMCKQIQVHFTIL